MIRNLALSLAALSALTPALGVSWVLSEGMSIAMSRMDPIVNPGDVSGHVHNIIGGSKFSKDITSPDDQAKSKCSSVNVQADKSNYWVPQLFYRNSDNSLAPMLGSARIYYFNNGDGVVPFPPGLKMISGLAMSRNETDQKSLGLLLSCNHGQQTKFMPTKATAPAGCSVVTMGIFFPSCGLADGSLDSDDHFSHMAWPFNHVGSEPVLTPTGKNCPDSHPVHYPAIFIEHNYWFSAAQPWRNEDDLLVLSNGDTTGLAYHADFHNGWDQDVLTQAIKECNVGDQVSNCGPFKASVSTEDAWNCRLEDEIPAEEIGLLDPLPSLPGCNPLWTASMPDTKPKCEIAPAKPGFVAPNAFFRSDWQRMNIPLVLPNATTDKLTSWYRPEVFQGLDPKVGGSSSIQVWGSETFAKYVKVSTVTDLLKSFVDPEGVKVEGSSASSSSAAASSTSSTAAAASATPDTGSGDSGTIGNVHLVETASSSSSTAASTSSVSTVTVTQSAATATVTVESKTCRR